MATQGQDIQTVEAEHLLQVYRRVPIVLTHGKGSYVYDIEGHAYLDFLSGIGVASLGHAHPGLATALGAAREQLRTRFPDGDVRRRSIDTALQEGGTLDVLEGTSADRVHSWLAGTEEASATGVFEIVLTSDDPDDLTLRQARALGVADTIIHDERVPEPILIRARADAARLVSPADIPAKGNTVILKAAPGVQN